MFVCYSGCEGISTDYYVAVEFKTPKPKIQVTHDRSCYDGQSRSGLCISSCVPVCFVYPPKLYFVSSTQTLADYFKAYRSYHKLLEREPPSSSKNCLSYEIDHYVQVGPARLKFNRTLRIPDDAEEYLLPPVGDTIEIVFTAAEKCQ